jgi:hypothetical protein
LRPDGGETIGRIYLRNTGGLLNGRWSWFFAATAGTEATAREAAKAVENQWFERPGQIGR